MNIVRTILFCFGFCLSLAPAPAATLQIRITPKVAGETLQPASLRYRTASGEPFSFTRVSWLASDFALQQPDGAWLEISNTVAWFDFETARDSIRLSLPAGEYRSLRFLVGLNPELNHATAAQFSAQHPLNGNLNGLHWSWQGGYIFMALEGLWRNPAGELDGWAYHLARDTNAARITLATPLSIGRETLLELDLNLAAVLNAPQPLAFGKDGTSTHSRAGDPIAAALVKNLVGAFAVHRIRQQSNPKNAAGHLQPLYLPAQFTAFPFQMSATFPIPDLPADNPLLAERVELGRKLFFDRRLSGNDQQSCADCHRPEKAFTDGRPTARGAEGAAGPRRTMTLVNLAWKKNFFWDGRARSLREQVLQPIQNPLEMHQSLSGLTAKLAALGEYGPVFTAAFGTPGISAEKIALALENYLLTLTAGDAKFDRVMRGTESFTVEEQRGFELFSTEYDPRRGQFGADCFHCHGGPLFQSQGFANNGLDALVAGTGRGGVTGQPADDGKFATPTLRNVALTGPYMHDGRFRTLAEVVKHYVTGIQRSPTLDPNLAKHPDGGVPLSAPDQQALAAFLRTLTESAYRESNKPAE